MDKAIKILKGLIVENIYKQKNYKALTLRNEKFDEIIDVLNNGNYKEIEKNSRNIILLLQQVYKNSQAIEYNDLIRNSLNLINITNASEDSKYVETFKNVREKFLEGKKANLEELINYNIDTIKKENDSYRKLYYYLKFKTNLTTSMVEELKDILKDKISQEEIDRIIKESQEQNDGESDKNELLSILDTKIDENIPKLKPTNLTDYLNTSTIFNEIIKELDDIESYYVINRIRSNDLLIKRYLVTNVLDEIEYQINGLTSLLNDNDFYFDKESRDEILIEFQKTVDKHKELADYMYSLVKTKPYLHQNQVWYESSNGTNQTYFEDDIESTLEQKETDIVGDLLIDFQNDEIEPTFIDSSKYDTNMELKKDNISVVLKHVNDKCYVVKGVIKNTDSASYDNVCNRNVNVNYDSIIDRSNKTRIQERIDKYKIEKEFLKMEAK